jgi:hypothetical protein
MSCECCGKEYRFLFPVLSRDSGFIDSLDALCSECAELINDEYYCGQFRSLVPLDVLLTGAVSDFSIRGSLVA